MEISKENKIIAKRAVAIFAGKSKVNRYWDESNKSYVDIISCIDSPCEKVNSYSTVGLSDYSIEAFVDKIPLRIEFVGACSEEEEFFPNILSTCAFNIINSKHECKYGTIFTNVIPLYYREYEMKHIMFVTPFVWDEEFDKLEFDSKVVNWLIGIPISEKEYDFAVKFGSDKLEDEFEKEEIDVFDLKRKSIF